MMDKLEALLIGGTWPDVMLTALGLLTRAGFAVDVISTSASLKRNRSMRDYLLAKKNDLLVKTALEKIKKNYTLVVVGDDPALGAISNSDLRDEEKLAALQQRAKSRGMQLNDHVGRYLLSHCPRDMSALFSTLDQLDSASLEEKRLLTIPFVKSVLLNDD